MSTKAVADALHGCATRAGQHELAGTLSRISQWAASNRVHVVFCGEFKRGKSSLVNQLLGTAICPTDRLPTTAVPAVLHHGQPSFATIVFKDGQKRSISAHIDALDKLSVGKTDEPSAIDFVDVQLNAPLLEEGFVFIDTPGVNDLSQQRTDVTYQYLPMADAAVVVLDSTAPVTGSEARFLEDAVFTQVADRIVFVLGKFDRLDEDEQEEAREGACARLHDLLGQEPVLVGATTRKGSEGTRDLLHELRRVHLSTGAVRESEARRRLAVQAGWLLDAVRGARARAEADFDETTALAQLRTAGPELNRKFHVLSNYMDEFGLQTLRQLIHASLQKRKTDFLADLKREIELLSGDVERYVNTVLPQRFEVCLKGWSERKAPEIDVFLRKLLARVARDFESELMVPLQRASMPVGFELPSFEMNRGPQARSRTETFLTDQLLPNAVAMGAGFLLLGPLGLAAGAMVGQVAGVHLRESKAEQQRQQLIEDLPGLVDGVFNGFERSLNAQVESWFQRANDVLHEGLRGAVDRSRAQIMTNNEAQDWAQLESEVIQALTDLEQ